MLHIQRQDTRQRRITSYTDDSCGTHSVLPGFERQRRSRSRDTLICLTLAFALLKQAGHKTSRKHTLERLGFKYIARSNFKNLRKPALRGLGARRWRKRSSVSVSTPLQVTGERKLHHAKIRVT